MSLAGSLAAGAGRVWYRFISLDVFVWRYQSATATWEHYVEAAEA